MSAIPLMSELEIRNCRVLGDEPGLGTLATQRGNLPLEAVDVHASIAGLISETRLAQTFVNVHGEPLEATYVFPLPSRAAVTKFVMNVNGREVIGVLKERGAARRDYKEAIEAGHRAAIAEQERPDVFTMRVGNLMPGEKATIHLVMTAPLPYQDGEATFRFPLVVAPRYIPGIPLAGLPVGDGVAPDTDAVPDASRISPPVLLPGFPNPVRLGITVDVDPGGLPLGGMKSSLHAITTEGKGNVTRISIHPDERLDRDFILRLGLGEDAVCTSLTLEADTREEGQLGEDGTFVLTLVPPVDASKATQPRDVVFVLDRSGSMGGWKMVASRRAVARMIDTLGDKDRFTLYAFDDSILTVPEFGGTDLVPATDRNRFRAVQFLAKVEAAGGTEMAAPLDLAAKRLQSEDEDRQQILVLVTDGQVGNEDQILKMLAPQVIGMRIFTVGIDRAVNGGFLERLAAIGGGSCELVEAEDRLDEVMDQIHRRIGTPVLTEVKIEPAALAIEVDTVTPTRMPALFAGAPLVIAGRYKGRPAGGIVVTGVDSAGRPWSETVGAVESANDGVRAVWARAHLRELEDRYAIHRDEQLEKRIVETSLAFCVLCRFTAFVAVDKQVVNEGGKIKHVMQPVHAPHGWDMFDEAAEGELYGGLRLRRSVAFSPSALPAAMESMRPHRLLDTLLGSRAEKSKPAAPPLDLAPYRERAKEILEQLDGADASIDLLLARLGEASSKLSVLVKQLSSAGAPASELKPLEKLLAALRKGLAKTHLDAEEARGLVERSVKVLVAFTSGGSRADTSPERSHPRGESFWK